MIDKKNFKKSTVVKDTGFIREYMLVKLDNFRFAFQIGYLREVADISSRKDIIPVPFTPSWIHGIIKIRGDIIPVISLPKVLGFIGDEKKCLKLAVIEEKNRIAFIFNEVLDMVFYNDNDIEAYKDAAKKEERKYISGQLIWEKTKIMIVDVYKLFTSDFLKQEHGNE